jgi:phage baseplate assembly protein W
MASDLDTPQFDLPFRLGPDGSPVEIEQDTVEEVGDCVEVLLRTPLGFYADQPDFGVDLPLFEESSGAVNMDEVQTAISAWEERADALIDSQPDLLDVFVSRVTINVRARTDA